MMRQKNGEECKICTRPTTIFRWNIANSANKSKKTIICKTCARTKNCCQSCMLDINFGIPLDVRDTALRMAGLDESLGINLISNTKNREVKAIMADKQDAKFKKEDELESEQKQMAREILTKLSEKLNGDDVNKPNFLKKKISNVDTKSLKHVNISKILSKLPFGGLFVVPEDTTIASFFIFGLTDSIPQYIMAEHFNKFGKTKFLTIIHKAKCGYVTFGSRESAELFAKSVLENGLNNNVTTPGLFLLNDKFPLRVSWGKPKSLGSTNEEHNKLSLVVDKVMKQLSEKDKAFESKAITNDAKNTSEGKKRNKQGPPQISSSTSADRVKYKAAKIDYEL